MSFHQPIKSNKVITFYFSQKVVGQTSRKVPSFKSSENKITLQKDNKIKEIDSNRNIIGKLLSFSIKANRLINFEEALNPNKAGLFEGRFFWRGQFDPPPPPSSYFKKNLSNINMTLYNC